MSGHGAAYITATVWSLASRGPSWTFDLVGYQQGGKGREYYSGWKRLVHKGADEKISD